MADEPNATEAAEKLAAEQGLDLKDVLGTGIEGKITKADVESHLAALQAPAEVVDPASALPAAAPNPAADDAVAAEIAALPTLQAVIAWAGDREAYQAELQARAKELLSKA